MYISGCVPIAFFSSVLDTIERLYDETEGGTDDTKDYRPLLSADIGASAMALAYVGNSHSMKFHAEGCRAEQKIRADHRVYLETREEAINAGYTPCGICKP